ncbi:hypothetical protein HPB47_013361 [Ixodes persulcatus]|uniref:Uncharacterized protein n=1 Tax=Ixodes persulcatus TaxID=34615 RepID=A0AC60R2D1_IXOPE|nr:hypothetical protein HPB47_013361 [Ixodes persulcatus]
MVNRDRSSISCSTVVCSRHFPEHLVGTKAKPRLKRGSFPTLQLQEASTASTGRKRLRSRAEPEEILDTPTRESLCSEDYSAPLRLEGEEDKTCAVKEEVDYVSAASTCGDGYLEDAVCLHPSAECPEQAETASLRVSQPASSESVSLNTSQSSATSSASPNYCQKPASNESISNGMDAGLNNSYGSSEVSFSSDLPKKIGEMQRELARREDLIRLLSGRLEEALRSREQVQKEASVQEQQLATEISSLKLELTTCMQLLAGQQAATVGTAADQQVASLQQALQCRDELVAQLSNSWSSEQQITVLQDIRADLLGRLTTVPVSTERAT